MKKLRTWIAFAFLVLVSVTSFAQWPAGCQPAPQVHGQPPRCWDGRQLNPYTGQWGWSPPTTNYNPNAAYAAQVASQLIPLAGQAGLYQRGNQVLRCSRTTQVVGNLLGGVAGYYLGRKIEVNNHRLGGVGAIAGAFVGDDIACEIVGWINEANQPVIVPQAIPQAVLAQPATVPQQVVLQTPAVPAVSQSVSGVFCNIDGVVTKEIDTNACEQKARAKAEGQSGSRVDVKSQAHAPACRSGTSWQKLNWPGHHQHDAFVCLPDGDPHRY